MSFWTDDKDKGIRTNYWVYLADVSLDFDSSWTPGSEVRIHQKFRLITDREHVIHECPRSLELLWDHARTFMHHDVIMEYEGSHGGPSRTSVIAESEEVRDLAQEAEYQGGIAELEIKRDVGLGTSTVRLTVRKISEYYGAEKFKLSVVVEYINREEWNHLREYQQSVQQNYHYDTVDEVPYSWRGSERIIEQMPKSPYEIGRNDITNDLKHVAHEVIPLVLKYRHAQVEAIGRGLSLDDLRWELPNHHETRVVRKQSYPSPQRDTCLRVLRLDLVIYSVMAYGAAKFYIDNFNFDITPITRSPSIPDTFSSINNLRLDIPYSTLTNAITRNSSSHTQTLNFHTYGSEKLTGTSSMTAGTCVSANGAVITLNVNGPLHMMGDLFSGSIYGGNIGGRNNTNRITAPPTIEAVAPPVLAATRVAPSSQGRSAAQNYEVGRKHNEVEIAEMGEDIGQSSKVRPTSFISRFRAALFRN